MWSNLNDQAAAGWRAESSLTALDAALPGGVRVTMLRSTAVRGASVCGTGAFGNPRPRNAQGFLMPGLRQTPGQTSASGEQDTHKKYQHATRAAGIAGSATGSHRASWDPV